MKKHSWIKVSERNQLVVALLPVLLTVPSGLVLGKIGQPHTLILHTTELLLSFFYIVNHSSVNNIIIFAMDSKQKSREATVPMLEGEETHAEEDATATHTSQNDAGNEGEAAAVGNDAGESASNHPLMERALREGVNPSQVLIAAQSSTSPGTFVPVDAITRLRISDFNRFHSHSVI
ncbi:hypothetical protein ACLMJK_008769 [Lecanora helva]